MWWLVFEDDGGVAVVILPGSALVYARLEASKLKIDSGELVEAHRLDDKMTKRMPKNVIGKRLTRLEAQQVLSRLA